MYKSHLATVIICLSLLICLLVASSTGAMTIRTVTKAAMFLLALWPFLGTGKCLCLLGCLLPPRLPHDPQGLTGLCRRSAWFSLCPSSAVMACLEEHPSGPALAAGALSGSQVGSGEGRQHKLSLRSHPAPSYKPKQWGRL